MHDTFLLERISKSLNKLCKENNIRRISKLQLVISPNSHIRQDNLYEHLKEQYSNLIGEWTNIIVETRDIEELTAVLDCVEGDTFD